MPPKLIRVFQTVRNKIQICTKKNDNYEKIFGKKRKNLSRRIFIGFEW